MGEVIKLIEDGSTRAALRSLERLWTEEAPRTTARNRYKLRANIGIAHLGLGDSAAAVREFRAAHAEDPNWPNARAILATAELLEGDSAAAFDLAKRALADDPTARQASAVIIDAAPPELDLASLEALIPAELRNHFQTFLCLSVRARKCGDFAIAESYARRALELQPNDLGAIASLAEVLLEPIFSLEGIGLTRRVPAQAQPRFDQALELLRRAWNQLASRDDIIRHDHVITNLISALDVAGLEAEADAVLDHALKIVPRSPHLLRRYAQKMASAGEWLAVANAIVAIPESDTQPQDRLIQIKALIHTGEPQVALDQARTLHAEIGDGRLGEAAAGLRIEAASRLGHIHEELDATLSALPRSIIVRSVGIGFLDESDSRRAELLRQLDLFILSINDPLDRYHAAEALYSAREYTRAADLYDGLHGTDKDVPALSRHLMTLYFSDRRLDARKLFDSLADDIKALPDYAEIGAAIYERSGLLTESRRILERALAAQEDLHKRLQWLGLCERLGDTNPVAGWLRSVDPEQQGRPRELMTLALAIDRYLGDKKCLPIAYRALRAGYGDPQIHLGYTVGLFLTGHIGRGQIETPERVQLDVAVVLTEKDGDRRLTRIIETETDPQIDHDEVSPDNPLARKLIGLRAGDEIEIENLGLEPTRYVVSILQNKYLYVHYRSLERFETMFPENRAFGSFKIDESKGDQRFKPLFDSVKRRGEFGRKLEEFYRSGSLPLAMTARMGGSSGFEFWDSVRYNPHLQFNTALGIPSEFNEAFGVLAQYRRAVVDPITLYALVQLGIAQEVRDCFEDLGIVQTALDLLRHFVRERRENKDGHQGTMVWDGEHYHMIELTEEALDHRIAQAEAALAFAEFLTVVPAEAESGIKEEAREIFDDLDAAYLDTVLAARGDHRLLLSDDRPFRSLAAEAAQVLGVWTQATAAFATGAGTISSERYTEITNALVEAGCFFTMINHRNFLDALKHSEWSITPRVQALIDSLARATNEPRGVLAVTADLIFAAWRARPSDEAYQALFAALFKTLKAAQPQLNMMSFSNAAFARVLAHIRARAGVHFRNHLLASTDQTPVETIAKRVGDIANRLSSRIAQALALGLAEA